MERIYLLLDSLYCSQLRDYLSGYDCQTELFSGTNSYTQLGLITIGLQLLVTFLYFRLVDPSESKTAKWGITLGSSSLASALIAYFWASNAEANGLIGQCLLHDDQGNTLISASDFLGLGISNAIIAAVFFFLFGLGFRYMSANNRYIPF